MMEVTFHLPRWHWWLSVFAAATWYAIQAGPLVIHVSRLLWGH
jgi:hypothetical protein